MEDLTGGTTRDSLNIGTLRTVEIPVAPIAEQRRIVAKLDALAARTARARADLDRVPVLAQMERRAILGRLFKKGWPETLLGEIASDVRYGTAAKCTYEPRGTPVLRIPNVANGRVDATDLKFASFTPEEIKKLALRVGDILVIRSNGSVGLVGRTAVVGTEAAGMLFAGYLIRIRVKDTVDPEYLNLIMQSAPTRNAIELGAKSSSGVHNINSEELKRIIVPLPTLQDQHAAVRDVSVAFAEIDRLVAEAAAARRLIDRLDQAILAKAFRGELAPQDPADEPASVMLDRIRAERAAAPAKAGRGRRAKASA
jgi:type I restriction enzyme S subunit